MSDWLLVIASMRTTLPLLADLKAGLIASPSRARAVSRLVVLDRDQLCKLFGPSFAERSRLFLEPPMHVSSADHAL